MSSFRLTERNERHLDVLAAKLGLPKAKFVNEALDEYLTDRLDCIAAHKILQKVKTGEEELISFADFKAKYVL